MSDQAEQTIEQSDADIAARIGNLISSEPPKASFPPAPQEREEEQPQEEAPAEEAPEAEAPAPEPAEPEDFEWEYDGEKYVLPKALKPLTEAQMRQADYTRKTQEIAEHRRILDEQAKLLNAAQQFQQAASKEFQELAVVDGKLNQFAQVDWARLWESDPVEAGKLRIMRDELKDSREKLASQLQAKQQEFGNAQQQHMREVIARGAEILRRDIKGWSPDLAQNIRSHAREYGFTEQELASVVDPRMVKLMHDAYQFKNATQANLTAKKVSTAPRVIKPGAATGGNIQKNVAVKSQAEKLKRSGSLEDAAGLLLAKWR